MTDCIKTDTFRRGLSDYARRVAATKEPIPIGTTGGRPTYLLVPAQEEQPTQIQCVRVGPDELRRNFSEIRSLVRLEDIPFGLIVDDQLIALFTRHPDYRPAAADNYRAMYRGQPEKTDARNIKNRVTAVETRLKAIGALELVIADLSARLTALEKRGTQGERLSCLTAATKSSQRRPNANGI